MLPLVVCGVLFLPNPAFAVFVSLIAALGFWEWGKFLSLPGLLPRAAYPLAGMLLMWGLWSAGLGGSIDALLVVALLWWLWALFWLSRPGINAKSRAAGIILKTLGGVLVLVPAWAALVVLHASEGAGPHIVLLLLVLIWAADSGAYFAGRRWGRTQLAPAISPGKTWEGVYGGMAASGLLALAAGILLARPATWVIAFVLVSLLAIMFSVVGDLLESLMKRQSGLKDSSNIIPGHGGILDRIDSLTAAAPVFLLGSRWLDIFPGQLAG